MSIIHIDGDAFFASCEVAQNERLRGKPVVTGQEKGMAIAVTYEAKALGVSRGMLMSEIRKLVPSVVILPGNYDLYKIYSRRMTSIVRRYAPIVEEYSVDECFADLSSLGKSWPELVDIAHKIKHDLEYDLGMTFSLGLAPTKTLAKVASKWKKPAGFTAMQQDDVNLFLEKVPIGAVWGIGYSTSAHLQKKGIQTALQFKQKTSEWVQENLAKPYQELWYELNGVAMHTVGEGNREKHKSIRATRTFRPPSQNVSKLLSELSKNAEKACDKLRRHHLQTRNVYFYLKTQAFRYKGFELKFSSPVTTPGEIINMVKKHIHEIVQKNTDYRATGIVLNSISPASVHQSDLFGIQEALDEKKYLYERVDLINKKYPGTLFLTSSLGSKKKKAVKRYSYDYFNDLCMRLGFPYWGEAV